MKDFKTIADLNISELVTKPNVRDNLLPEWQLKLTKVEYDKFKKDLEEEILRDVIDSLRETDTKLTKFKIMSRVNRKFNKIIHLIRDKFINTKKSLLMFNKAKEYVKK